MLTASKRALATGGSVTMEAYSQPTDGLAVTRAVEAKLLVDEDERNKVRGYILDSILLGTTEKLDDSASLLDAGILDSTGTMELVAYLEDEFGLTVFDSDIVADNLDTVDRICAFIQRAGKAAKK